MLEIKQLQNPNTSLLLAFKPRQVVLAESSKSSPVMAKKQTQDKSLLHQSILHYLHINGFSKTLKYFLKETQTEGDNWKSCSLSLEELYNKYLNNNTDNDTISKGHKEPVQCEDDTNANKTSSNAADSQETISKKKKKKKSEDKISNVPDASKKKKKSEDKISNVPDASTAQEVLTDNKADVPLKKKEKKKKKTEEKSESVVPVDNGNTDLTVETTKKDKKRKSKEESGAADSKDSKKRKRLASDENENQAVDGVGTEESKRRKTEGLEQEQNGEVVEANSNGNHQDEFNNSAKQKSSRKELNGSAEPKNVNAFQRVKIDQVEFKDDRLKDNSYWAKEGADIGYGAKAQEVLGQVKGRDFRHEKTKKKRGSYRGGIIDLNSHSVKFNYSDEE
ncbi:suppressor protein SRP40 isoform X2 [Lycium barbarum]|uniref:suppressor protein SRP40 isoform X2 n=1 Tax=Lycium barbarum TaxID=112863 RepID=UPI00293E4CA3|nr:suppressor protein SRP40 isoform X2 [Lycium barbarum]